MNRLTFKRRWTLLTIGVLAALSVIVLGGQRQHRPNNQQRIAILAIPLDPARPQRTELDQLRFLGAWVLTSENDRFGGLSGLAALPGGRFVALGDGATLVDFRLTSAGGIADAFIRPLPWRGKPDAEPDFEDRDSESLVRDPGTGQYWVSFENHPALRRYSADLTRELQLVRPRPMKRWPANGGAEALARLPDGRFIVFSEAAAAKGGGYEALLFPGAPSADARPVRFAYAPPRGFRATDAKALPDGRLLILHRRLAFPSGLSASIGIADPAQIRPGILLRSTQLARLEAPLAVDNMEGLAVTQEAGRTIAWIISDNNFNAFQRTLLMKFALPNERRGADKAPGFVSLGE